MAEREIIANALFFTNDVMCRAMTCHLCRTYGRQHFAIGTKLRNKDENTASYG